MKILVPTAGPIPAKDKAGYIVNIAKRLGAGIIALHILREEENEEGDKALAILADAGRKADVAVDKVIKKGNIVSNIIESAEREKADLIVMGASEGKIVAEWISAGVMGKTKIPVVVIPHEFKKS